MGFGITGREERRNAVAGRKKGRARGREGGKWSRGQWKFLLEGKREGRFVCISIAACLRPRPSASVQPTDRARVRPRPVPPAQDILPKTTSEASASALPYVAPVLPLPTAVSRGPAASLLSNLEIRDDKEDGRASKSYLSSLPLYPSESNILSPKTPSQQK